MERSDLPKAPVVYDLGSGEGAFTEAWLNILPEAVVYAVEADERMIEKFTEEYAGANVVPEYLEDFLQNPQNDRKADIACLTDVLEHVLYPEEVIASLMSGLKPGGCGYITLPNLHSLPIMQPVRADEVDWARANVTCQHLWIMPPEIILKLHQEHGSVIDYSRSFETRLRGDSDYCTVLVRRS
jgi:2-polyprenyl-3-methyl-5-hydroxy-6-metoxy-1,4-benzoquinol methylase